MHVRARRLHAAVEATQEDLPPDAVLLECYE